MDAAEETIFTPGSVNAKRRRAKRKAKKVSKQEAPVDTKQAAKHQTTPTGNERHQRAAAALLGAIVGDAAAQTSHWNYDKAAFHKRLRAQKRFDKPEFFVSNKFYRVAPGGQSCYGDQSVAFAQHLVEHGSLRTASSATALVDRLENTFGGSSVYGPSPSSGRAKRPLKGPWRHGSLKLFLANLASGKRDSPQCGGADSQVDCIVKTIPIVCAFAGHPDMLAEVEAGVRITQNHDDAVAYAQAAALVLEACIIRDSEAHSTFQDIIRVVVEKLQKRSQKQQELAGNTSAKAGKKGNQNNSSNNTGSKGSAMPPATALALVDSVLSSSVSGSTTSNPSNLVVTFDAAATALGRLPVMKPHQPKRVSLVA